VPDKSLSDLDCNQWPTPHTFREWLLVCRLSGGRSKLPFFAFDESCGTDHEIWFSRTIDDRA
jgi:hypothetical protein